MTVKNDAFIVTINDEGTASLLDRASFNKFSTKKQYGKPLSDQLEKEKWQEFKKPELSLTFLANLLRVNTHHEACCRRVAHDVGGHGWSIVPSENDGTEQINDNNKKFIESWLNHMSNTPEDLFYQFMYDYEAIGCAALELIRDSPDSGRIIDIQPMNPCYLQLHKDGVRVRQFIDGQTRWFTLYGTNYDDQNSKYSINKYNGKIEKDNIENVAHEIIWARNYSTNANNYGHAKVSTVLDVIMGEIGRMNYNNKFFENYGMPAFAVSITGDFIDYEEPALLEDGSPNPEYDETQTLRYKIQQQLGEVIQNPHSAVTIAVPSVDGEGNVDVKFTPLSVDQKEASFRLYRQDNKEEICEAHGFSSDLIGTTKSGTLSGSTAAEDNMEYVDNVIEPLQVICENTINDLLLYEFNITDWKFKFNDIRKKDITETINQCHQLWLDGVITRREYMETVGKQFGANSDVQDLYVDDYMINGVPVEKIYGEDFTDNDLFYNQLETDLLNYANTSTYNTEYEANNKNNMEENNETNNPPNSSNNISTKYISNSTKTNQLQKIIQKAFRNRK